MNDSIDRTQSRPPLRGVRGADSYERAYAREQRRSSQRPDRMREGRSVRQAPTGSSRSVQRGQRREGRRCEPSRRPVPGVPLIPAAIVLLVCVLLAVFVTRASMAGKVNEARAEAATAQAKVEELTRTLERERAAASSSSRSQSNGGTSVAGAAAELGQGEGVEDPWLSSGRFGTGDEALDKAVKEFCDARVSTSMGLDDAALEVYKAIAWSDYVERDNAQHPAGKNWRIQYALQYYENGNSGNCYEFASFLMYCLRYLGFEDAQAEGVLVQLQSGAWGDHGIVYVTNTDGTRCMCDTARGTDGWMLGENAYNVKIEDFESA